MCPDSELLSAYYDGELDQVWSARIADHVTGCAACQTKLARFAGLSGELAKVEEPDFDASMIRSWKAVQAACAAPTVKFWRKRISIPVPVVAAAAAVLIAVFGLAVYFNLSGGARQSAPPVAVQQSDISPVDFQVNNLTDLLNYLNSKDLGTSVTIQLPKGVDQLPTGKPQLIRAADFNRGQ